MFYHNNCLWIIELFSISTKPISIVQDCCIVLCCIFTSWMGCCLFNTFTISFHFHILILLILFSSKYLVKNCIYIFEYLFQADREKFTDICFFSGDMEVVINDLIRQLRTQYGIVRPICQSCLDQGNIPNTRNALKVGQKRKK